MGSKEPEDLKRNGKSKSTRMLRQSSKNIGQMLNGTPTSVASKTDRHLSESMLFAEDTLASRSPLPESAAEKPTLDIFGPTCSQSFASYDRNSASWKMSQDTFPWDSDKFSETFPSAGTMRNGRCYLRQESEHLTSENEFSSLPTPRAHMGGGETSGGRRRPSGHKGTTNLTGWVKMWPTIRSSDGERGGRGDLIQAVRGNPNSHYKMWPTPLSSEGSGGWQAPAKRRAGGHTPKLRDEVGGALNPTWVEWLMGFPPEWTALDASETPSSRKSRKKSAK